MPTQLFDAAGMPIAPAPAAQEQTPVFTESIGGALIDSARISVMAAMQFFPEPSLSAYPDHPDVQQCLLEAMEWLNAARAITVEQSAAPPTSLHVIAPTGRTVR